MSARLFKAYYQLTKPGIIYGNILTMIGGFLLAAKGTLDVELLGITVVGLALLIASACASNNYLDRDIDAKMARTQKRGLVTGVILPRHALFFAAALGLSGMALLALVSPLVAGLGLFAFIMYVFVYGPEKRRSVYGTLIGSIPGAMPIVIGYAAVTGHLDGGATLLFLIMVLWQMPHFYAIALYRLKEYAAAAIPVLPIEKGAQHTKLQILIYIGGFTTACCLLTSFGYTDYSFLVIMSGLGVMWLLKGIRGFHTQEVTWARGMFFFSLIILTVFSILLAIEFWLP